MTITDPRGASSPARETVLRLSGITKRFGGLVANDAIDLDLARGEVLALLGENGAGKSTLVSILFGHYVADEGTIEANGRPLPAGNPAAALAAGIGMVHQHFTLADNLSVLDNVMLGTEPLWQPFSRRREARRRLVETGARFGLGVDPDALVARLSVGRMPGPPPRPRCARRSCRFASNLRGRRLRRPP
jgi:general nucleoside transport system ATP-binding protein